jgi:hypothetical protein
MVGRYSQSVGQWISQVGQSVSRSVGQSVSHLVNNTYTHSVNSLVSQRGSSVCTKYTPPLPPQKSSPMVCQAFHNLKPCVSWWKCAKTRKRDIVDAPYHALCVLSHNKTKQTGFPITWRERRKNGQNKSVSKHISYDWYASSTVSTSIVIWWGKTKEEWSFL